MTNQEMSNEMDTLLNSYSRSIEFGNATNSQDIKLDEYEKSVFLTQAQQQIIIGLYNGDNVEHQSFESTEELRRYLVNLVKGIKITEPVKSDNLIGMETYSVFYQLPSDLWFIIQENINIKTTDCYNNTDIRVIPVKHDYYQKQAHNPFRGINKTKALRLDIGDNIAEIVCSSDINYYYVRYMTKPSPIILIDLNDGLSIDNTDKKTECKMHEALHRTIVETAVQMALASKGYSVNKDNR